MTDVMTPEQRRRCMQHIHSRNTKPEILVRKFLFAAGLRFRNNVRRLPGTPDIVLKKYKTVIFINGCFWHGHSDCHLFRLPKTNTDFWRSKIERNKLRDARINSELRDMGWNVIQIWECQLRPKYREATLESLLYTLNHILLLNYGAKIYQMEDESPAIAAEEEATYSKEKEP